jgi:hypothetical protein
MNFETAKYEHRLPAKSFFRTTVSGGGSVLAVDFRRCLKIFPLWGAPRGFEGGLYMDVAICIARAVAVFAGGLYMDAAISIWAQTPARAIRTSTT